MSRGEKGVHTINYSSTIIVTGLFGEVVISTLMVMDPFAAASLLSTCPFVLVETNDLVFMPSDVILFLYQSVIVVGLSLLFISMRVDVSEIIDA
jgi:hypothetical protein